MNGSRARWEYGHHLFVIYIQAITISVSKLQRAIENKEFGKVRIFLADVTRLLETSAISMKFAADFPEGDYRDVVRPSLPGRFSGLDMMDHKDMLKEFKDVGRTLATLPDYLQDDVAKLRRTLEFAYDSHILVCSRFVGRENSLRNKANTKSAIDTLGSFKETRLSLFPTDPRNQTV